MISDPKGTDLSEAPLTDAHVAGSPTQRNVGHRGLRVILLWVGMVLFFVILWNWVGPGSVK